MSLSASLDAIQLATSVAIPLVERAAGLLSGILAGNITAPVALAQIRALHDVTLQRIADLEGKWASRDAEHDSRVASKLVSE